MGYNLVINGVYWGYNLFTNYLLTSWDIQVLYLPTGNMGVIGMKFCLRVSFPTCICLCKVILYTLYHGFHHHYAKSRENIVLSRCNNDSYRHGCLHPKSHQRTWHNNITQCRFLCGQKTVGDVQDSFLKFAQQIMVSLVSCEI